MNKFVSYLLKYPEIAVRKRAGFILEKIGINKKLIEKIKKSFNPELTYVVLNVFNKSRKGKINKEWGLIINE